MLRLFFRNSKQLHLPCVQLTNLYSTKNPKDSNVTGIPNMTLDEGSAGEKMMRCLKRDAESIKRKVIFWKEHENPAVDQTGRVLDWDDPRAPIFPNHCDILIIGGGAIGSACAFFIKCLARQHLNVVVVEKDPSYKQASTVLSVGGLRQQFSLEENIEMSLYGADFIRRINDYLGIEGEPPVDVQFHPYGYLSLATADKAEILEKNSKLQNAKGAKNVLLSANQMKQRFPWLTTDDIELGCLGLEREGWFDPWLLLSAFKRKAISMGVHYIAATAKGFHFKNLEKFMFDDRNEENLEKLDYCIVETEDGKLRPIKFSKCIVAAGAFSGKIAEMAKIGHGRSILSVPLPVEPRKRYVYCFHAPNGPGMNTPMTIDPSGVYFRREGLDNQYICGRCPDEGEEPPTDNLDVDHDFFNEKIWPILAQRVKDFENLKVKSSWAGYYEYNTFDKNGIVGCHPYHDNLIFATGFSGHGIQQAPAVGRAVSEIIANGTYSTIDLSRLCFERFITQEPMREHNIW